MKTLPIIISSAILLAPLASATDINVSVEVAGSNSATVSPGETVTYSVVAELSDAANEGLAFFTFDLSFEGGALSAADSPTTNPMLNFDRPLGMTNPSGFGGTPVAGDLVQIGGAQNTWNNIFAPVPTGAVFTNVASPGTPVVLATGSVTAPLKVGDFELSVENLAANVIRQGEVGFPFWAVDAAGVGNVDNLTITVDALQTDVPTLSVTNPGTQTLTIDAGVPNAGRQYFLVGSISGTSPGQFVLPGITIPLNFDFYTTFTFANPNTSLLSNNMGTLNGSGQATATFNLPNTGNPGLVGLVIHHAYVLLPVDFVSEAEALELTP